MHRLISSVIITLAAGTPALAANPAGLFFNNTFNHVDDFKHPTAMLITGQCNRPDDTQAPANYKAHFTQARAAGAEVLVYIDPVERHDGSNDPCDKYTDLYTLPDGSGAAPWPSSTYGGPATRVNWPNYHLIDISKNSAWSNRLVAYVEQLMRNDDFDGVFLDVLGGKLWDYSDGSGVHFSTWSTAEQDAWTDGAVDLVKRLDERRRAVNPRFIIINNNTWDRGSPRGIVVEGEQHVDGVVLEQKNHADTFPRTYAARTFADAGHRRVLVITRDQANADAWNADANVTHVAVQDSANSGYGSPPAAPTFALTRLTDRPKKFGRVTIAGTPSVYMGADRKRASKFTLADTGHLTQLYAYVDGQGGTTGTQSLQMDLYRDSNGVPGTKVAASQIRTFDQTATPAWRTFSVTGLPLLTPGDYWIAIHSGLTGGVTRNYVDTNYPNGATNWFTNTDTFSDGATSPFGAGSTGSGTLSVFAMFLVGQ
jgi:hypothetical protein